MAFTGLGELVEVVVDSRLRLPLDPAHFAERVKREFTYPNPEHARARRMQLWNLPPATVGTWRAERGRLTVPRGCASRLRALAVAEGVRLHFLDRRQLAPVEFPAAEVAADNLAQHGKALIARQLAAIDSLIARQNAYLRASTGFGKTLMLLEVIRRAGQRALFLVPDNGILAQTVAAADELLGPGYAGTLRSTPHELREVVVATYAMAHRAVCANCDEWSAELRASFGLVVCDELQFAAARTVRETVEALPAKYRFGCSADERRKDGMQFLIHDSFGAEADHITVEEAVEEGRILEARIVVVPTGLRDPDYEAAMFGDGADPSPKARRELYRVADEALRTSFARNELVARRVAAAWRAGHYCLALVRRVEHAEELRVLIEAQAEELGVVVLRGGSKREFDEACDRLRSGEVRCAVGTSKAYQGLNVPRLDRGFVVVPAATNPQLLEQMVGRFRRACDGKVDAVVEYFWDERIFPGHKRRLQQQYGRLVTVEEATTR